MPSHTGPSVVLVDDHPTVRAGTRHMLAVGFTVVGEAGTLAEARAVIARAQPDLIVLDLNLGEDFALDHIGALRALAPGTRVLVLTMHDEIPFVRAALDAGADGYLLKDASEAELLAAAQAVAAGRGYLQPELGARLARRGSATSSVPGAGSGPLPERHVTALRLWAAGHTDQQVADALGVGKRTAESLKRDLRARLGLSSRADVVRYVREHLDPDD